MISATRCQTLARRLVAILACIQFGNTAAHAQQSQRDTWIKPPGLRPGDTIAIVAPAGPINQSQVNTYAAELTDLGFRVSMSTEIGRRQGYLAGTDQQRVDELNAAIRDPKVRAIFAARGGYGLTRILDQVDYDALRDDPKIVVGYSDLTALHLAIASKAKLITFHGPMPMSNLWQNQLSEHQFSKRSLFRAIEFQFNAADQNGYSLSVPPDWPSATMRAGTAHGRLVGGNLSLVAATLGTPMAIEPRSNILFLEDIEEAPYRIDRMLSQLRLAGVFDEIAGVVLGDFTYQGRAEQAAVDQVLQDYFAKAPYPVLWKMPIGHIPANMTLPHGAMVELNATDRVLRLLENPVVTGNNQ